MREKINKIQFNKPLIDIISNVTAKAENDIINIKKLLIDQIFSTVRWRESIIYMENKGIKNFVEIGPGKALSGMTKRTLKGAKIIQLIQLEDIKNLKNELLKEKILITGATGRNRK